MLPDHQLPKKLILIYASNDTGKIPPDTWAGKMVFPSISYELGKNIPMH